MSHTVPASAFEATRITTGLPEPHIAGEQLAGGSPSVASLATPAEPAPTAIASPVRHARTRPVLAVQESIARHTPTWVDHPVLHRSLAMLGPAARTIEESYRAAEAARAGTARRVDDLARQARLFTSMR